MAIEIDCILESRPGRVPLLPVVAVHLRPAIDTPRVLEGERGPGAPVEDVRATQVAEVIDLEASRLPEQTRLEAGNAATVLSELELLGVSGERSPRWILGELVARLLIVVDGRTLRAVDRRRRA